MISLNVLLYGSLALVAALFFFVFRKEHRSYARGLADLLPWGALVSPGVALNKDGSLLAGWSYRGPDLDSATHEELAALSDHLNAALLNLGNGWMLHADAIRRVSGDYPESGAFPDPVTRLIDEERREQYQGGRRNYETTYALLLTFMPPDELKSRALGWLLEGNEEKGVNWQAVLGAFEANLSDLEDVLSARLDIKRLDSHGLLTHLHSALTGLHHPVSVPPNPCYLDVVLASQDLIGGFAPRIGEQHIRVIAITGFPFHTTPGILDHLNRLPIEYRWSTRFLPLDPQVAARHITRYRLRWWQKRKGLGGLLKEALAPGNEKPDQAFSNRDAVAMAEDADSALAKANAGTVRWGYYTPCLVLMHPDEMLVEELQRQIIKEIRNRGFAARRETVNALEAFRGSLAGCGFPNVRRPLINTLNLADLLPITSLWPGLASNPNPLLPKDSPALLWAATSGSTPFRLNLHVSDVGHTLVIGPTGAGKSALVALLEAQFFRYPGAQVFTFDKGYSSLPLVAAAGGHHYDIAAVNVDDLTFYPLARIHEDGERTWAVGWLEILFDLQGLKLNPYHRAQLERALDLLAHSPTRTITELAAMLEEPDLRVALSPYVLDGSLGRLLDADADGLTTGHFQIFEMSHLMQMGDKVVVPLLLYLFHQIERRLDGRPTLIVIEEAWTFLMHGLFAERIQAWLKELRKRNAAVVFVTQSLGDIHSSPLRHVLYESCPTKIFLANPEAGTEQGAEFYRTIGLNQRQVEIIARAVPKRDYYYTSPNGRRLIDLTLGPVALSFVGAASAEHQRQIRDLKRRFGAAWPAEWLRARNLPAWADRLAAGPFERSLECLEPAVSPR